ncbi:MAG TPA: methyltransferase domain-containing protein [Acidobacteriota bacterium]|nr:methyltransferase domain-containing protein [Acidobacteriota bacterium]
MADRVCPWWLGYALASPLRRLFEKPETILSPYVRPGMTAVDVGSGMGFFSLPLARMVGSAGRVVSADLQPRMINSLRRRAQRAGLLERMDLRVCPQDSLGLDDLAGTADFVLLFAVVHEVPDQAGLMVQVRNLMNPTGRCLLAEPAGHVTADRFAETISAAEAAGLTVVAPPAIRRNRAVVLGISDAEPAGG